MDIKNTKIHNMNIKSLFIQSFNQYLYSPPPSKYLAIYISISDSLLLEILLRSSLNRCVSSINPSFVFSSSSSVYLKNQYTNKFKNPQERLNVLAINCTKKWGVSTWRAIETRSTIAPGIKQTPWITTYHITLTPRSSTLFSFNSLWTW